MTTICTDEDKEFIEFLANMSSESPRREDYEVQSVIVHLKLANDTYGTPFEMVELFDLQAKLVGAVLITRSGFYDGVEIGSGEVTFFFYTLNADKLYETIKNILFASPMTKDGYVTKTYGPLDADSQEMRVELAGDEESVMTSTN